MTRLKGYTESDDGHSITVFIEGRHTPPTSTPGKRSKRRKAVTPPQSERYNGHRNSPQTGEGTRKSPHPLTAATASALTDRASLTGRAA